MASDRDFNAYRDVLYDALAGGTARVADTDPASQLRRLSLDGRRHAGERPALNRLLDELYQTGATSSIEEAVRAAQERFPTAAAFQEAIYTARCLNRSPEEALRLIGAREYLMEAVVPDSAAFTDLTTDRAAVLDLLSMETLWRQPARLPGLLTLAEIWQQEYFRAYTAAHLTYHSALAEAADKMEAANSAVAALRRLNGLYRLGPAVAVQALLRYDELSTIQPCSADPSRIAQSLAISPFCASCNVQLGAQPPSAEARRVVTAIDRGLSAQQTRLARRIAAHLLERATPDMEARLQRFLEVIQASDLRGLTAVLDDEITAFIDELLAETSGDNGPLQRLIARFPTVTAESLDAAVEEFRRLMTEEVDREGIVRLRTPAQRDR